MRRCRRRPSRSHAPTRSARRWRDRTTRTFRSRRGCCRRPMRPHVAALYAFARVADDIADEGAAPAAERQARLARGSARLHRGGRDGRPSSRRRSTTRRRARDDLILAAIAHSIRSLDLPLSLFDDLVSAFGQDTMTTRYDSWTDVFDYCRRSANPVGRLVLRIAGYRERRARSIVGRAVHRAAADQLLAGLRTRLAGRPSVRAARRAVGACGADEADLDGGGSPTPGRARSSACVDVTRELFARGRAVCDGVRGRLRFELRLTWLGGRRILDRVAERQHDLLTHRPKRSFWRRAACASERRPN